MSWFGLGQRFFFFTVASLGLFGFVIKTVVITEGCFFFVIAEKTDTQSKPFLPLAQPHQ